MTLAVENTGAHLDRALVATLSEPFRRGAERVHDDHGGVGLGLAIAQRITAAHDGRLDLAARPGGGCSRRSRCPRADVVRRQAGADSGGKPPVEIVLQRVGVMRSSDVPPRWPDRGRRSTT